MNTSTIIRRAVFGSSMKFIHLALAVATSFYLMPFLVHTLGTEQYGIWILASAFAGYYGFLDFGVSTAVGRFQSKALGCNDKDQVNIISSSALAIYFVISTLIIFITCGLTIYIDDLVKTDTNIFSTLILVLGFGLAVQFPARSFGTILVGSLRHDILEATEVVTLIIRTGLILFFISSGHGILTLSVITVTIATLTCVLNLYFVKKVFPEYEVRFSYVRIDTIKEILRYAKTMFVYTTSYMVKIRTLPFIVTSVVSVHALVVFNIAATFINYFKEIITAITGMSYHITSRLEGSNNDHGIKQVLIYATAISTIASTYIATSLLLYGKTFIVLWMGEQFLHSYTILTIMCLEAIVFMMEPSLSAFAGLSKHKINATLNTIDMSLSLILAVVLGQIYGLTGVAIGISAPLLIKIIAVPYYTKKELGIKFVDLYVKIVFPLIIVTGSSIIVFYNILRALHEPQTYFDLIVYNMIQPIVVAPFVYMLLPNGLKQIIKRVAIPRIKPICNVFIGG